MDQLSNCQIKTVMQFLTPSIELKTDTPRQYFKHVIPIHSGVLKNQDTLGGGGVNLTLDPPLNPMFDVQT